MHIKFLLDIELNWIFMNLPIEIVFRKYHTLSKYSLNQTKPGICKDKK